MIDVVHYARLTLFTPIILLAVSLTATTGFSRTWVIKGDGSGDAPTIQAGIDNAAAGDTVLVLSGTYVENCDLNGKNIALISKAGPELTQIDGSSRPTAVIRFSGTERSVSVEGFTIRDGNDELGNGGGVYCATASPVLTNNIIKNNHANWGGGVWAGDPFNELNPPPSPRIQGCTFEGNTAVSGGGAIMLYNSQTRIEGNNFVGNLTEHGDGGAINVRVANNGRVSVIENMFFNNEANDKGGAINAYQNLTANQDGYSIVGNLFVRNVALGADQGDLGAGGAIFVESVRGTMENNTLVQNRGEGESPCGGGAITMARTLTRFVFRLNLVADNSNCGCACEDGGVATFETNLLWMNSGGDLGSLSRLCPEEWWPQTIQANPQFCDSAGSHFTVAVSSPAVLNGIALGAFPEPGCGPVSTLQTTWGRMKFKYRE